MTFPFYLFFLGITLVCFRAALADMPKDLYSKMSKIAEEKVKRQKTATQNLNILALNSGGRTASVPSIIPSIVMEHSYRVGERWTVATWPIIQTPIRMAGLTKDNQPQVGRMSLFDYEVVETNNKIPTEIKIKITVIKSQDLPIGHSETRSLTLGVQDKMVGRFPPDIPDVSEAIRNPKASLPTLPGTIAKNAEKIGYRPDLPLCNAYDREDFFGRPVHILWQPGSPWPEYLETSRGIALLVKNQDAL